ncbi:MAG: DUF1385 domain-containing protein [Negativicutes bacterium]|nr:DUF1385 domain-containing protein [Negativicutes bacterium]
MGMAILLAVGLFIVVPTAATRLLHRLTDHPFWLNVGEGGLRLAIFVGYIGFISLFRDIRRVFQYHGAEHRVINAFEHKSQLLAAEVQRHSMRHLRCGTSFLLLVMVISVVVFAFLGWPDLWLRILSRVAMLPVIAGLSYELLRLCARYPECWPIRLIAAPGLWLQAMTTRPPDDHQVEVAIVALRAVLPDGGEVN